MALVIVSGAESFVWIMKLMIIAGARPNFIKIAPIIRAIEIRNRQTGHAKRIEFYLVHTGQHYDAKMSEVFFNELGIPEPDYHLAVGSGSHAVQTFRRAP